MNMKSDPAALQGSVEWLMERVGFVTASRFKDVLDMLKSGKPGAKREAYLWEIVVERLTKQPTEHYVSTAMQWGTDQEPFARMAYEAREGAIVHEVGFLHHPTMNGCGGSPDGLVGEDGMIEIKSPWNPAVHLDTLINGMPTEHMAQVQGLLWITGRKWCDFVSYAPTLPPEYALYIQCIDRSDDWIKDLETRISSFLADVDARMEAIKAAMLRNDMGPV